jgi:hypothetical protein
MAKRAKSLIVGIHGLKNKTVPETLEGWWKAAIKEGLVRNCGGQSFEIDLELVYWADLMYARPTSPNIQAEPYVIAGGTGPLPRAGLSARKIAAARIQGSVGKILEKILGAPVTNEAVRDAFKIRVPDLVRYKEHQALQEATRNRLIEPLRAAHKAGRRIMLIAHSMGSIIAFEVLRDAGRTVPGLEVSHFVTVGSPLGLAEVEEVISGPMRVPECVARWSNFADPRDQVARWDTFLSENFEPSSRGVAIVDQLVINGYVSPTGKPNPHKIYGYLRAPEISDLIASFVR